MTRTIHSRPHEASEREALRRRVTRMYEAFNKGLWEKCFALVDPKLRDEARIELPTYAAGLQSFSEAWGSINPWHVRINLHLDAAASKRDDRPFAYVYVVWQDDDHGFHMFRERWVKHQGHWFTRVAGLVPHKQETQSL
jgi:hypothetical protein